MHFTSLRWTTWLFAITVIAFSFPKQSAAGPYDGWKHHGELWLITTADGAALPDGASLERFPVLVQLHKDFFDFSQADAKGNDLRFATSDGSSLKYQIDEWNPTDGIARIWVRVPKITGNAQQAITAYWGNPAAASESDGKAVFNASNGYLSVWHMGDAVRDEVGTLESKDVGTTPTAGIIGQARHLAGKQGVFCGDKIPGYPVGADSHSTQAWFRIEKANSTIISWGNEEGGRGSKIRMMFRSPPHIRIDSNFSDVRSDSKLPMNEWIHVAHTYTKGEGRLYINGQLDGSAKPMLNLKSPAKLWIGGWYNNYDFQGDLDEVRISSVTRSPEWVKTEYENQKPLQTLAGPLVSGKLTNQIIGLHISPAKLEIAEGTTATVSATASGARKIYWTLVRGDREEVIAVDRLSHTFAAGRVAGDQSLTLRLKAVYADGIKSVDVPVTIKEAIADPQFTLSAPHSWDGRSPVAVKVQQSGAASAPLQVRWKLGDMAVTTEESNGELKLLRAHHHGTLTITATADNGGAPVERSVTIRVTEPPKEAWARRTPDADEKPIEGQFYARDDRNEGTLYYNGSLTAPADEVFLRITADDKPFAETTAKPGAGGKYALSAKLKPGLIRYAATFGTRSGGKETIVHTVGNLLCGDAYIIEGQSNAVATDWGKEEYNFTSPWIRSFGNVDGNPKGAREAFWDNAGARVRGGRAQVGCWAMELGKRIVDTEKVPVCFINGAVGGTRVDQHQRNPADPEDVSTIYGRLLWRVKAARLTHGIRGIFWHQGENDQGADGPTGDYGYATYREYFIAMATAWKRDYPNVQRYHVFQIWPKSCAMGVNGSDNQLREVQRQLPTAFENLTVTATLGVTPAGTCHYIPAGYEDIARHIFPVVQRDHYGKTFAEAINTPNLLRAAFADGKRDEIVLQFDQPMTWQAVNAENFYFQANKADIASATAEGATIRLKLTTPTKSDHLTYLDSKAWKQETLLRGKNGLAALTFCDVVIEAK